MLEIVFAVIKLNQNIDKLRFFERDYRNRLEILKFFDKFSKVSGLKLNKSKCEIAGIGPLKGVRLALCSMQCINLNDQTVKILEIHFFYNKKIEEEKTLIIIQPRSKMF